MYDLPLLDGKLKISLRNFGDTTSLAACEFWGQSDAQFLDP
jgi:hypothetical protein